MFLILLEVFFLVEFHLFVDVFSKIAFSLVPIVFMAYMVDAIVVNRKRKKELKEFNDTALELIRKKIKEVE